MRCLHPAVQGLNNLNVYRLQIRRIHSVVALSKPQVSLRRGTSLVTSASASSSAAGWPSREPGNQNRTREAANNASPLLRPLAASPGGPLLQPLAAIAAALLAVYSAASRAAEKVRSAGKHLARLQVWLGKPEALLFREGCQLLACLMFILLYVWSTYSPVHPGSGRWWLDLVLSLLFAADYVHRTLTSSRSPLLAALHPLALIDLLSFAPSLLGALLPEYTIAPWGWDLRWFRVFRALRLLRLSLLSGNLSTMKTNRGVLIAGNLNVPLVWLVASVVAWMFTSASCVAVMEKLPWHDALYFVGSTLTTVGYGDVVVRSSMGRLFVLVMMLVGVVLIPVRASQLYSRLSERLLVAGHKPGAAPGTAGGYVLLSGRLSDVRGFNDFLQDFLVQVQALSAFRAPGAGGGRQGLQLVCLCNKPSVEFLALQELHESHLTLVEGSAFSERDLLHRAGLPGSVGAMVLADRFSSNATAEDTDVQFRVWAIKSAVKRLPLYVQVLRRSSVDVISPFLDPLLDVIMSVEGTRLRLLALSTLVPGASTLIANLLRSSGPNAGFAGGPSTRSSSSSSASRPFPWSSSSGSNGTSSSGSSPAGSSDSFDEHVPGFGWQQKLQAAVRSLDDVMISHPFSSPPSSSGSSSGSSRRPAGKAGGQGAAGADMLAGRRWLREYADGAHCELFMVPAGPPLAGLGFTDAAQAVYEASGALVVGLLEVGSQRLLLNPSTLTIHQQQQLVVLAPSYKAAATAAAGAGVEAVLYSQALQAAQDEAAAAAAAVVAAHQAVADQLQKPANGVDALQQQQQQQQAPAAQPPSVAVPAGAQTSNIPRSSKGDSSTTSDSGSSIGSSNGLHRLLDSRLMQGSLSSMDGSRSVTVRVPDCLSSGLDRGVAMRQRDSTGSAGTNPDYSSPMSSSSASGGVGDQHPYPQQRQYAEQLPKLHHPQQQQQQWEMPGPASPAAGAVFAQGAHYADAYAAFELQQAQQLPATPLSASYPAAAGSTSGSSPIDAAGGDGGSTPGRPISPFEDAADDLVSGCLAPWSGAFESDSLDETELCTDSEMMEAALLMRQKQQAHEEWLQQQQQQWPMLGSYDSSSMHKQQAAVSNGVAGQQQPSQAPAIVPPGTDSSSSSTMQASQAQQAGPAVPGVSVTSIAAAALDQHLQQQQQQQPAAQAGVHGPEPQTPPSQLAGHFILAGCVSSFVQFARQLAASASPAAEPVTVVLLHPEYPGPALEAIRRMGLIAHHVTGRSSDASALLAAGARRARSLVYVGPSERPTSLPVTAVSGVYGDPTSHATAHADVSSSSRTAVLADADALSSCYGVGEVFLPDSLSTIVELGFTSSIRFLQPGLLLHGRPAPHSSGSVDETPVSGSSFFPGQQLLAKSLSGLVSGWNRLFKGQQQQEGGSNSDGSRGSSRGGSRGGSVDQGGALRSHPLEEDGSLSTGSPAASRTASPWWQHQQALQQQQQQQQPGDLGQQATQPRQAFRQRQQQQQRRLSWPWQQELLLQQQQAGADAVKLPRSSWRHRKEIEEAGQLEGLTEWQLNSYYAAGRVMVPALLDVFTCQGFFRRQALLDLLTELAGDDGRPGGAMLQQQAVPSHLIGCSYHDLVAYYLCHPDPLQRHIPLGLLRRKAENRAWRLPYVATHPHPDTLLQATDLVYVLRPQQGM